MPGIDIPFNRPYLVGTELGYIQEACARGHLSGNGWFTKQCHGVLEEIFGGKVLLTQSATSALEMSAILAGLEPGDEVIKPSYTITSTANAFVLRGAVPVFVDIRPDTLNVDETLIEGAITPRTRAIMVVHYGGVGCEMRPIMQIAERHGLVVIEDAAHATEGVYHGRRVGTLGDAACFSFYVTKNLVTGEGGMVTTSRADWAEKIQTYGLHGLSKGAWKRYSDEGFVHYQVLFPGFKYNMTDMQAALGIHQLARLEQNAVRRREIWARYDAAFADLPAVTPAPEEPGTVHARHLYTLLLDLAHLDVGRDAVLDLLKKEGIGTGIHFISLHLHPYYRDRFGFTPEAFPGARHLSERTLSLPLSARLTDRDVEDVIQAVRKVLLRHC